MRILYAIQGTGNGHVSRAADVGPELEKYGEVDYMISGAQVEIGLSREAKYRSAGLSFYFGKAGGIDFSKTWFNNSARRVIREINEFPVQDYDLILNDFEPISAWAAKLKGQNCIALSHQSALLSDRSPKPDKKDALGTMILKNYAPASAHYGLHFDTFDDHIYTPVVRKQIRQADITNHGHYTVYLPAYSDKKIVKILSQVKRVNWQVFSKHCTTPLEHGNVSISPVNNERFVKSLVSSEGVLCGAGFETPAEALYLGKKLMVIPMKNQYEQQCNAAAMQKMGVPVIKKLKNKYLGEIVDWAYFKGATKVDYPDQTSHMIANILKEQSK